jgi:hypothetical protein
MVSTEVFPTKSYICTEVNYREERKARVTVCDNQSLQPHRIGGKLVLDFFFFSYLGVG